MLFPRNASGPDCVIKVTDELGYAVTTRHELLPVAHRVRLPVENLGAGTMPLKSKAGFVGPFPVGSWERSTVKLLESVPRTIE